MLTLQTNPVSADKPVVITPGTLLFEEYVSRDYETASSYLSCTFSGLSVSGMIDTLETSIYPGPRYAENMLEFLSVPDAYSTVTISGITYTFIPLGSGFSASYQVPLGPDVFVTALNFHRAFNAIGVSGIDYNNPAHPAAQSCYANDRLVLQARTTGTAGNYITLSSSDERKVGIGLDTFYNGRDADNSAPDTYTLTVSGIEDGTYRLGPVSYNDVGYPYQGTLYFKNAGVYAVTPSGVTQEYSLTSTPFFGRTSLIEFAEVSGLQAINLYDYKVESDGLLMLTWSGMSVYQEGGTFNLCDPDASGTPTQSTRTYSANELAHTPEYCVFVYVGSSSPQCTWPRDIDANGTWYFAGRVNVPHAVVQTPPGSPYIGIWVGYGNKGTWDTTVSPFRHYHSQVYLT